jgi:hypothetical protein
MADKCKTCGGSGIVYSNTDEIGTDAQEYPCPDCREQGDLAKRLRNSIVVFPNGSKALETRELRMVDIEQAAERIEELEKIAFANVVTETFAWCIKCSALVVGEKGHRCDYCGSETKEFAVEVELLGQKKHMEELEKACRAARDFYDRLALSSLEAAARYGPGYIPPTDEECLEVRGILEAALGKGADNG